MHWAYLVFCGSILSAIIASGSGDEGASARADIFQCQQGASIPALRSCDGVSDCADGSDETERACAGARCPPYTFQCAYGACVDQGSACDGKRDCPDGSDEDAALCGRGRAGARAAQPASTSASGQQGPCELPPQPEYGGYVVSSRADVSSNRTLANFTLQYRCDADAGYGLRGPTTVSCAGGRWSHERPQCLRLCRLDPHPSVEYLCPEPGSDATTSCTRAQPSGARVMARCKAPDYYSRRDLPPMTCMEGSWDYIAICKPDCGRVTAVADDVLSLRPLASRNKLPWHVRVYSKRDDSYRQICSGSIISNKIVVSGARCFCTEQGVAQPAALFAAAAGKIYQSWDDARDYDAQQRDVAEIKVPPRFGGARTNFQDDIALLVLSAPLTYEAHVRPVCLDFDDKFERQQLQQGNVGRAAGRVSAPAPGGAAAAAAKSLRVLELPHVGADDCLNRANHASRKFITSDKICAGCSNGTTLCIRDNGGGLAFLDSGAGETRYYLRGVLSAIVTKRRSCNTYSFVTLTSISHHEAFIKEHIDPSLIGQIRESGRCRLPPYPEHGGYAVAGRPYARPGDTFEAFFLNYTCNAGHGIVGKNEIYCYNGYWSEKIPYCIECGLETPVGQPLIVDGAVVERFELPWHVAVYRKDNNGTDIDYKQICGGTIVSTTVVISAAHCFWSGMQELQPASRFAVAAGSRHRTWNSSLDRDAQTSDVADIKIPSHFRGGQTNFQDDIALVVLSAPLAYQTHVRPVCLDFDDHLENKQLQTGHIGKVAGWGFTSEDGTPADTLRMAVLPYVDVGRCLEQTPPTFYQFVTSDKICAGYTNGTALCKGDSGGGLVFPKTSRRVTRYYLRGVASTAPVSDKACNANTVIAFTQITKHANFIRRNLGDVTPIN